MGAGNDYDAQLRELAGSSHRRRLLVAGRQGHRGRPRASCGPVYDASDGVDGYVSVEVAPALARDTEGTIAAARELHERIAEPNLYVKIPGTAEGMPGHPADDQPRAAASTSR